ncbi:hypothetical protein [Streptomyces abikoensis]|uniref:hypothetical protein n=1 Tax=Streptomyces abikoensis TaxID=97398 RepID=UPI0036B87EBD
MSDEELIVPSGIPQFTGNVDTLVSDAKTMTSDAKLFRDSGASVHSTFQGLQACYKAPEAEKLFATTAPVAAKAGAFASDLEKVSGALSTYATEIRPLAKKLGDLKDEAIAFVASVEGDDHWRRDKKKVDHNNNLWRSVNATVAAFTDAERSCHDKIVALVGGDKLIADDGTHKPNMYGYKASDLDHAEQTPWGSMAEREYTGIAWLGHQIKSFVWDGFIVDGVWGTIKGLGTLVGTDGWDKAGQAWTGLAKLATGLAITASPLGAAYWMTPDDKLPSWLRDSRTAMKETGKALVAYDQWGKNPARAAGGVTFNVLTTVFTGGSGAAAKGGAVAKTVGALSKVAKVVDPMTYVGKAGKFAFVKVGDLMSGLKNLRVGSTVHLAEETFKLPGEGATLPKRPPNLPETAVPFLADGNKVVYLDKGSSRFFDAEGKELQAATKELSADERAAKAAAERQKQPQPQHSTVSEHEKVPVAAGVHVGGDATSSAARGGEHIPGGGHGPGSGPAGHTPTGGPAGHAAGGHATGGTTGHAGATAHTSEHSASSPTGHTTPGDAGHPAGSGYSGEPGPSGVDPIDHRSNSAAPGSGTGSGGHGPAGQHAGTGPSSHRPWEELTEAEKKDIVREQVEKANDKNSTWRDDHYTIDHRRKSLDMRDADNGYPLPHLKEDPAHPGKLIQASDGPPPIPSKPLGSTIPGIRDTATPENLAKLDEAAKARQTAITLDDAAENQLHQARSEHADSPTPESAQALEDASREYKLHHDQMGKKSEAFGEAVAEHGVIPEHYPNSTQKTLHGPANGNDQFDQVWQREDGSFVVVEAKSQVSTPIGDRTLPDGRKAVQGSRAYFEDILRKMRERGATIESEAELARDLRRALRDGKVEYIMVKGKPVGDKYNGYLLKKFDLSE